MRRAGWVRQHLAALRALLVLTVITGVAYPLAVWAVALLPGLRSGADGALVSVDGEPVGVDGFEESDERFSESARVGPVSAG